MIYKSSARRQRRHYFYSFYGVVEDGTVIDYNFNLEGWAVTKNIDFVYSTIFYLSEPHQYPASLEFPTQ